MTTTTSDPQAAPVSKDLFSRFVGVVFSPQETFRGVIAVPRWFGMLALITVFMALATFGFLSTEVGRQALLDQQVSQMEAFGIQVSDQQYEQMEDRLALSAYLGAGAQLIMIPLMYLVISGILYAIFSAIMGGVASFKQLYAVVVHAGAISVVQQLFVLPLNYARGSMSSPTNLAALLPMLPEGSFLTYLLGTIDVFVIWWLVVLAIGLGVLYNRRTQPVAITLFAVYAVVAVIIAAVRTFMGGS